MFARRSHSRCHGGSSRASSGPVSMLTAGKVHTNNTAVLVTVWTRACAASVQWVALHGYLDSAASFDQLAPLLTSACPGHAVLALDYPGHGRSSPLAPGQMYHLLECVKFVRMGG